MDKKAKKYITECFGHLEQMVAGLDEIFTELEEKFEAKSQRWQESDNGTAAEQEIEHIRDAKTDLDTAKDYLSNLIDND